MSYKSLPATFAALLLAQCLGLVHIGSDNIRPVQAAFAADSAEDANAIRLSTTRIKQGEVFQLAVDADALGLTNDSDVPPPVEFLGQSHKLFVVPDHASGKKVFQALIGVPVVEKAGTRTVTVGTHSRQISVIPAGYPVQRLTLPPSKNNFNMAFGEEEAMNKAKGTVSEERLWQGNFSHPSKARQSSGFGIRRIVNGKLLDDYFHSGIDYAGFTGSPITACAPGKVILAKTGVFKLHGNTVAIDHGQGVISIYIHMQKIEVKLGDRVSQGQKIGTIGQTGRANGPHLHFSIYCNKTACNPNQWYKAAF
jgi:murein DD-endopeptidase MepM/ murein hydrolase activator NlpD